MTTDDLIEVCNYEVAYSDVYSKYVAFIEYGEDEYPLFNLRTNEVPVFSRLGDYVNSTTSVVCDMDGNEYLEKEAYRFGLTMGLNRIPVTTGGPFSPVATAFRYGFLDGGGQLELILDHGIGKALKRGKVKTLASRILMNGGCVLSCLKPDLEPDKDEKKKLFAEAMSTRKKNIVSLGLSMNSKSACNNALMDGSEVYIHTLFMRSPHSKLYAYDGAELISSATDYIVKTKQQNRYMVYPVDGEGQYSYLGQGYEVLDLMNEEILRKVQYVRKLYENIAKETRARDARRKRKKAQ